MPVVMEVVGDVVGDVVVVHCMVLGAHAYVATCGQTQLGVCVYIVHHAHYVHHHHLPACPVVVKQQTWPLHWLPTDPAPCVAVQVPAHVVGGHWCGDHHPDA